MWSRRPISALPASFLSCEKIVNLLIRRTAHDCSSWRASSHYFVCTRGGMVVGAVSTLTSPQNAYLRRELDGIGSKTSYRVPRHQVNHQWHSLSSQVYPTERAAQTVSPALWIGIMSQRPQADSGEGSFSPDMSDRARCHVSSLIPEA